MRDYVCAFIRKGVDSLSYKRPSGRPPKLAKTQRKELADLITAGPEAAGYTSACWSTPVICDLILTRFGVRTIPITSASCWMSWASPFRKPALCRITSMKRPANTG